MNSPNHPEKMELSLQGWKLIAARLVWATTALFSVIVFAFAVPVRYAQLRSPEEEFQVGLARLGYSPQVVEQYGSEAAIRDMVSQVGVPYEGYAALTLFLEVGVAIFYIMVALLIFWRKSGSMMGIFASLFLITFGIGGSSYLLTPFQFLSQASFILVAAVFTLAFTTFPLFFYLFPDGRLLPRWAWILAALWIFTTFFWNFTPRSPLSPTNWPESFYILYVVMMWVSTAYAQIYRYRHLSSMAERQQTKWLVFGFGVMVLLLILPFFLTFTLFPGVDSELVYSILIPVQTSGMSIIPIALAISILRYRLWDVDVIIRRTLQYALLTGLLALAYFGGVVILQSIIGPITGQENSPLVAVVTTLGVAALFNPLRSRLQDFIDQRFYRKKYNAEKALTQFSTTARDEVELGKLVSAVLEVVHETMRPEQMSIWVNKGKE